MSNKAFIQELVSQEKRLRGSENRTNWEDRWRDVADLCYGSTVNILRERVSGEDRSRLLDDMTAVQANRSYASTLFSLLVNPQEKWFNYGIQGIQFEDIPPRVLNWLEERRDDVLYHFNNNEQFARNFMGGMLDDGVYGIFNLYTEFDKASQSLSFRVYNIRDFVFSEDIFGQTSYIAIEQKYTAAQLIDYYGEENVSENTLKTFKQRPETMITVLHVVKKREKTDPTKNNNKNMPFGSYDIEKQAMHLLKESGYEDFPHIIFKGEVRTDEIYPDSPAINALAGIREANQTKADIKRGSEMALNPPLAYDASAFDDEIINIGPQGLNAINFNTPGIDPIRPLFPVVDIRPSYEMYQDVVSNIRKAFFADELEILAKQNMTATEVIAARDAFLRRIAPSIVQKQHALKRLIERVDTVLSDAGMLETPPDEIQAFFDGNKAEITINSPISRALLSEEQQSMDAFMERVFNVSQAKPDAADLVDIDVYIKNSAKVLGVTKLLTPDEVVEENRAARAQAEQEQAEMQMIQQGVATASQAAQSGLIPTEGAA